MPSGRECSPTPRSRHPNGAAGRAASELGWPPSERVEGATKSGALLGEDRGAIRVGHLQAGCLQDRMPVDGRHAHVPHQHGCKHLWESGFGCPGCAVRGPIPSASV